MSLVLHVLNADDRASIDRHPLKSASVGRPMSLRNARSTICGLSVHPLNQENALRALFFPAVALSLMAFAGCTTSPSGRTKNDVSVSRMEQDKAECAYQAKSATASYRSAPSERGQTAATGAAIGDGVIIAEKQAELANECMRLRRYSPR